MSTSRGGGFGEGARSPRLERSQRGDPRARRSAQAVRTTDALGEGLGRDQLGKQQVDIEALVANAAFMDALSAALAARGFVRS